MRQSAIAERSTHLVVYGTAYTTATASAASRPSAISAWPSTSCPQAISSLREERQVGGALLVDLAEARHHVEQQEQAHQRARGDQEHRIDRGVDRALADRLELRLVGDVARERRREVARLLRGAHRGDVERREHRRRLLERGGERLALRAAPRRCVRAARETRRAAPSAPASRSLPPAAGRRRAAPAAPG